MRKILFLGIYFASAFISSPIWGQDLAEEVPAVEMRRHRQCHKTPRRHHRCPRSSSHRGGTGPTGPTGPTGARGATGLAGATGLPGGLSPSFGSFYSTSEQVVLPGDAVFFGITGVGPIGTAFIFEPGTELTGSSFIIDETGYYAISYGLFTGQTGVVGPTGGIAVGLQLNTTSITGSYFHPGDAFSPNGEGVTGFDLSMPAFMGIFHLDMPGVLQLVNISSHPFVTIPPSSVTGPSGVVDISAYINIQLLDMD